MIMYANNVYICQQMSEFPSADGVQSWTDMAAVSEKLGHPTVPTALHTVTKKGPLGPRTTSSTTMQATTSAQVKIIHLYNRSIIIIIKVE